MSACGSGRREARRCSTELEAWLRTERARLSRSSGVIKPIDYMLKRWDGFARFVHDGRICLTNNAAERALCSLALGRSHGCSPAPIAVPTEPRSCPPSS